MKKTQPLTSEGYEGDQTNKNKTPKTKLIIQ